ncbi:uncharacterized protein PV06_11775 [Exophiala oligosperma]|uniref:FAD-binding domain-containing protein n=1 Tax=Exophiala oligosperma TaxID=215243 RepID=A0A0D2CXV2_9EURO|nr:uncharacterized protein PV06_11775 [Exophiala oligosperma]KIW35903.1 hypothetical protein PV06_11775 [Exophiala oligosperma]
MEVLRDAALEDKALSVATSGEYMMHTTWQCSLAGEEIARLYSWGNDHQQKGDYQRASPCSMTDVPQSVLEPILVEAATESGAEFRFNTEFVAQEPIDGGRIRATVRNRASGDKFHVLSRYLLGCDGARSAVFASTGIPIIGKQLNNAFNVHIESDLSNYFKARPGGLS